MPGCSVSRTKFACASISSRSCGDAGYEVLEAGNGVEALEILTDKPVDLVLCDIMMPVMDGYALLQEVRANHPDLDDLPFIFLTALADPREMVEGLALGADDYLTKPIDYDGMLARVSARLRQTQRMESKKEKELVKLYKAMSGGPQGPGAPLAGPRMDEDFIVELEQLAKKDGQLSGGKVQFVSLDPMKERFGDQWTAFEDKAFTIADGVIRDHLGGSDLHSRYHDQGFLLLFPGLSETEAMVKTDAIATAIAHKLLGENADVYRGLSLEVKGVEAKEIMSASGMVDETAIGKMFGIGRVAAAPDKPLTMREQALKGLEIGWEPVWNLRHQKVASRMAEYTRHTGYGEFSGAEVVHGGTGNPYLADIDLHLCDFLTKVDDPLMQRHGMEVLILPLNWATLRSKLRNEVFDTVGKVVERVTRRRLLLDLRSIPPDTGRILIEDETRTLRSLCGGLALRFDFPIIDVQAWTGVQFIGMHFSAHDLHQSTEAVVNGMRSLVETAKRSGAHSFCTGVDDQATARLCAANKVELIVGNAVKSLQAETG